MIRSVGKCTRRLSGSIKVFVLEMVYNLPSLSYTHCPDESLPLQGSICCRYEGNVPLSLMELLGRNSFALLTQRTGERKHYNLLSLVPGLSLVPLSQHKEK